jgi:hypothetical protein
MSPTAMLLELPLSPPMKTSSDSVSRRHSGEVRPHRAPTLRSMARMLVRTLGALKGQRLRGRQRDRDDWVIV